MPQADREQLRHRDRHIFRWRPARISLSPCSPTIVSHVRRTMHIVVRQVEHPIRPRTSPRQLSDRPPFPAIPPARRWPANVAEKGAQDVENARCLDETGAASRRPGEGRARQRKSREVRTDTDPHASPAAGGARAHRTDLPGAGAGVGWLSPENGATPCDGPYYWELLC
jgi:hypothetical protein